jgi:hypothetical protein
MLEAISQPPPLFFPNYKYSKSVCIPWVTLTTSGYINSFHVFYKVCFKPPQLDEFFFEFLCESQKTTKLEPGAWATLSLGDINRDLVL